MDISYTPRKTIEIDITPKKPYISVNFDEGIKNIDVDIGVPHSGSPYEVYDGPTTIIPEAYEMQILQTTKKSVMEDIVVLPIPYFETSNPQGGTTVYIGE